LQRGRLELPQLRPLVLLVLVWRLAAVCGAAASYRIADCLDQAQSYSTAQHCWPRLLCPWSSHEEIKKLWNLLLLKIVEFVVVEKQMHGLW